MADLFRTAQEQWRLPLNPYAEIDEVLRDPQYIACGFWTRPDGGDTGMLHPGMPVIMSETPWRVLPNPPAPFPRREGESWSTRVCQYLVR